MFLIGRNNSIIHSNRYHLYALSADSPESLINNNPLRETRARSLARTGRQPPKPNSTSIKLSKEQLDDYLSMAEISGISYRWLKDVGHMLDKYLSYTKWRVDKKTTIMYLKKIKGKYGQSYYRKNILQIRKFLNYLNVDWANDIKPPAEPYHSPKIIRNDRIIETLRYFNDSPYYKQMKAIILLGASSGLRAEELYQLEPEDIDIDNRIVYVNHNPKNGQTTKTGKSRIAFFNEEAQQALIEYMQFFNNGCNLKKLFSQPHVERAFRNAPMKVKDLRKFFSQEWERRSGSYAVKELLMGHSLKKSVDLQHYTYLDENDLKEIYDKVIPDCMITKA